MSNMDNNQDEIISLRSATGEDIDFIAVAEINHKGGYYLILQPVELLPGMEDNEAIVFKIVRDRDGSETLQVELDDSIVDGVFEKYERLIDDAK
jgi:uncharacterized protein YrzB (UPF0473 family)